MEPLSKLVEFLAAYPSWVKYLVVGLIFSILVLLIVFRPTKLAGLSNWKLRVYYFETYGDASTKQRVGERLSGKILDDLLRRQLNVQKSTERQPLTSIFSMRGSPPNDVLKSYLELAPFVEVSGYIEERKDGDFELNLRVAKIDASLEITPLLSKTYKVSKDESTWQALSQEIGEEIFALLSLQR